MSLLQEKLVKELPTSKTLAEAGRRVGYSPRSRTLYKPGTKRYIAEYYKAAGLDKEGLIGRFKALANISLSEKDLSNSNRSLENIARMQGLLKDNQQTVNVLSAAQIYEIIRTPSTTPSVEPPSK